MTWPTACVGYSNQIVTTHQKAAIHCASLSLFGRNRWYFCLLTLSLAVRSMCTFPWKRTLSHLITSRKFRNHELNYQSCAPIALATNVAHVHWLRNYMSSLTKYPPWECINLMSESGEHLAVPVLYWLHCAGLAASQKFRKTSAAHLTGITMFYDGRDIRHRAPECTCTKIFWDFTFFHGRT